MSIRRRFRSEDSDPSLGRSMRRWLRQQLVVKLSLATCIAGAIVAAYLAAHQPAGLTTLILLLALAGMALAGVNFGLLALLIWRHARLQADYHAAPATLVRGQGARFLAWFAGQGWGWLALVGFVTPGLLLFFGPQRWVLATGAGLLAGALAAGIGSLVATVSWLGRRYQELGICWPSQTPDGIANFWERAGVAFWLRRRFETAVVLDLAQPDSKFRRLVAVLDLARIGETGRPVNLGAPWGEVVRREVRNRAAVLAVLFAVTAAIVFALPPSLWLAPPSPWIAPLFGPLDRLAASNPGASVQKLAARLGGTESQEAVAQAPETETGGAN